VPLYFASLVRSGDTEPVLDQVDPFQAFGLDSIQMLNGLASIDEPSADGFVFRILRGPFPVGVEFTADEARLAGWTVRWIGFEPASGEEPTMLLFPFV